MNMSEQQHAYLKAMGIDIWVERVPSVQVEEMPPIVPEPVAVEPVTQAIPEPEQIPEEILTQAVPEYEQSNPESEPSNNINSLNWQELKTVVAECQLCDLSTNREKVIFGAGNQSSSLMILGDAPVAEDEKQGLPFSGEAGNLLTAMIRAMGYQRHDVYISNLVKCRTGENQDPSAEEVAVCDAYLKRQIQLIQPKVILALGSVTAQRLFKSKSTMSRLRGQLHYIDDIVIPVIVTYEPGYLLRSPSEKRKAWEDLQLAMKELSNQ